MTHFFKVVEELKAKHAFIPGDIVDGIIPENHYFYFCAWGDNVKIYQNTQERFYVN